MVAKAVRCQHCRAKKIKCDQQWPQCGQCQRGKRCCPGPPQRIKFVSNEINPPLQPELNEENRDQNTIENNAFIWSTNIVEKESVEEIIGTRPEALVVDDAFMDKFELAPPLAATPALRVASRLILMAHANNNPFHMGSFVERIPGMLESSLALTATAACCVDACVRNERSHSRRRTLDSRLYGKALGAIHQALDDPRERTSITTFLAVALMQRLETTFAMRQIASIPCWSVHAGGVSELLKYRGVFDPNEDIVFETICEQIGPIISHSVFQEDDCFLADLEWQPIFQMRECTSPAQKLFCIVIAQLAFLPGLIKGLRRSQRGEDAFAGTMDLAISMINTLSWVGEKIDVFIIPVLALYPADLAGSPGSPVTEMYSIPDHEVSRLLCWHAALTIMVSNIFCTLGSQDMITEAISKVKSRNLHLSTRLWMLSEAARQAGPMKYYFYPGALANTYQSAESEDTKQWIVDLLSDIHGSSREESPWTHETVQRACDTLAGRM